MSKVNNRGTLQELSDKELVARKGATIFCDTEIYDNYWCIVFTFEDDKVVYFEGTNINYDKLVWILSNFEIITFNGINFDIPMMLYFIYKRPSIGELFHLAGEIINFNKPNWKIYKENKIPDFAVRNINHIDIKEVCIGQHSLKMYAARVDAPYAQDLPYEPHTVLSDVQIEKVLRYCVNDCINTKWVFYDRKKEIDLRRELTIQYSADVRSKSDAQIAEVVIDRELSWRHGIQVTKTTRPVGHRFKYQIPDNMKFKTDKMNHVLDMIRDTEYELTESDKIYFYSPEPNFEGVRYWHKQNVSGKKQIYVDIGSTTYKIGIGGLHSEEKNVTHIANNQMIIVDRDVTSYYPYIILNQELYPKHLGKAFLGVYRGIVERRIEAKRKGDKSVADTLKIVINGSFGKFGSKYSFLFSPELLIQTTVSGQLYLLMLIESLELNGFSVVSANTDGIVTKIPIERKEEFDKIVEEWEKATGFGTEENEYLKLCSRDVNNYVAVQKDGTVKSKGAFAKKDISKNPYGEIIKEAVHKYLSEGKPVEETIYECDDVKKFIFVRKVKGGCVDDDKNPIGKVIRYYFKKGQFVPLRYATNGNKVPQSDGAYPIMDLSVGYPDDIDYGQYVHMAKSIINSDFSKPEQLDLFA